jgi:peptidyl-prolyl cis-trans isomerase B (cyclophilin B)
MTLDPRAGVRPITARLVPLAVCLVLAACGGTGGAGASGSAGSSAGAGACAAPAAGSLHAPSTTPLPSPPAAPAGDGTTATIKTGQGDIVIELYNRSSPVAATNFIELAKACFYNGVGFHRIVPGFVIQGGDPEGSGSGGPGYTIKDEPVVGDYTRAVVAMARTPRPNSQGSQFFICLGDLRGTLDKSGGYAIFGKVTKGMDVVDKIAAAPNDGSEGDGGAARQPVLMTSVTISTP